MEYTKDKVVSDLYKTSKSSAGVYLMEPKHKAIEVYDFDELKKLFCSEYRNEQKLCSCDAYYENPQKKNYLAIEFKNAGYQALKEYFGELYAKAVDSHMLLLETFWRRRKVKDVSKHVKFLVVYRDGLNYDKGVVELNQALCSVKPKRGNTTRAVDTHKLFGNSVEFEKAKKLFKEKFTEDFFQEIEFLEKKDFEEYYVNAEYFEPLQPNQNIV